MTNINVEEETTPIDKECPRDEMTNTN